MNHRQKLIQQQFLNNEKEILNRLKHNYGEALKSVNDKVAKLQLDIDGLNDVWADFDGTPEEKEILLSRIQSKIYQKQYQQAIQGQIDGILKDLQKNAFDSISEYLDKSYEDGFVGTMFDLQGQGIPLAMPIDQQAMVRAVQLESKISNGLYSGIGEDVADLKKRITMEVSRGLANGSSYSEVARCIKGHMVGAYTKKTGGALYRAEVIARTEGHRVQVQATMDACYGARDKGADVVKQWDSTLDGATRPSHAKIDGEVKELDERFSNGLMFPGDPNGGAKEVINCRCALLQRARWAVGGSFTKMNNFTKQLETFDTYDDYAKFKKDFFSKENRQYMNYVQEMEQKYGTKKFEQVLESMTDKEYNHYSKLLEATPIYKNLELNQTVKITNKKHVSDYGVVERELVNSKKFHDKFENLSQYKKVNESIYQESMKMLEHRDGTNLEDLVMIDSRTGKIVESVLDSTIPGKVKITKAQHKKIIEYDGMLTMLHNHPNGSRPSIEDIRRLTEKNINCVISVGHDGSVYMVSNLKKNFDIDNIWNEVYNNYKEICKDDILAQHYALDSIYAMGIFDVEIR